MCCIQLSKPAKNVVKKYLALALSIITGFPIFSWGGETVDAIRSSEVFKLESVPGPLQAGNGIVTAFGSSNLQHGLDNLDSPGDVVNPLELQLPLSLDETSALIPSSKSSTVSPVVKFVTRIDDNLGP